MIELKTDIDGLVKSNDASLYLGLSRQMLSYHEKYGKLTPYKSVARRGKKYLAFEVELLKKNLEYKKATRQ